MQSNRSLEQSQTSPDIVLRLTRPEAARLYSLLGMCQWTLNQARHHAVPGPEGAKDLAGTIQRHMDRSKALEVLETTLHNEIRPDRLKSIQTAVYSALVEDDYQSRTATAKAATERVMQLGF